MEIKIGENILSELDMYIEHLGIKKLYIITDDNVHRLYSDVLQRVAKDYNSFTYVMPSGEKSKSIKNVFSIYDDLIEKNIDRKALIVSFGGGVVGDITGFIAATYKRGLKYVQIPTTLLSQADSSIGGKVGINYKGYKNIIGSFYFPVATIIDTLFLETLYERQITCGLGEILKYGLIYDYNLFKLISSNLNNIYNLNHDILLSIIKQSVSIKDKIVKDDIYDKGLRQILNFGHTVGHSIEGYYNFSEFNHGEAVILGMIYEFFISKEMGLIDEEYFHEVFEILNRVITPIKFNDTEAEALIKIMENDKKNTDSNIVFVLPVDRGKVDLFKSIDREIIIKSLKGEWF